MWRQDEKAVEGAKRAATDRQKLADCLHNGHVDTTSLTQREIEQQRKSPQPIGQKYKRSK
jgi:hypothetical protein